MSERETRDFISVDAFSQLPFIRPPPPTKEMNNSASYYSSSGIRIFGIQMEAADDQQKHSKADTIDKPTTTTTTTTATATATMAAAATEAASGGENSTRKFECHYCRRNFPTSQALGGHQNAHKRERQNAKRAHLQTALAASHHQYHHGHQHPVITEAHLKNFVNYHRSVGQVLSPPPSSRFCIDRAFDIHSAPHYSSWSTDDMGARNYPVLPRLYGGSGSMLSSSQPMNGNPAGMWKSATPTPQGREIQIPLHRDRSLGASPLFGPGGTSALIDSPSSSTLPPPPQIPFAYQPKASGVKDQNHFSLDLHL